MCTVLSPGPLFRLVLEGGLEIVYHRRLFLCFVLCLLAVTGTFVCFSVLFLKQSSVMNALQQRQPDGESRKADVFEDMRQNSRCCALVRSLWNLCLNMTQVKIPNSSVLFLGDKYNAVLALSCSTLGLLSGYKAKTLFREGPDEKTRVFNRRFKAQKLTNVCLVQKNILIRYKISPIKISDKTNSVHCDIQHNMEMRGQTLLLAATS